MKKFMLAALLITMTCESALGAQIFTTTIQNTTVSRAMETSLAYMTGRNFVVERLEAYTITFRVGFDNWFGDGPRLGGSNMYVKFDFFKEDDNVKLMATQFYGDPRMKHARQRAIEPIIPLVKHIRYFIDGTPSNQVVNEATD